MSSATITGPPLGQLLRQMRVDLDREVAGFVRPALEASAKHIEAATPVSKVRHQHMVASYSVIITARNAGAITNNRPYAGAVLFKQRKTAGAISRQQALNQAIDAEEAALTARFSSVGLSAERALARP